MLNGSFFGLRAVIAFILGLVLAQGIFQTQALATKLRHPAAPPTEKVEIGPAMTFTVIRLGYSKCEPNCPEWIQAEGEITDQTPDKLSKLLANTDYRRLPLLIDSMGGKVYAAMKMGRLLRSYGMNTAVAASNTKECWPLNQGKSPCNVDPATRDQVHTGYVIEGGAFCNSACSWVLLAGVERIAGRNTYVGLHQPHGTEERWVDHYWDTWRIVNGKKHITSHRFIKRTYVKPIYIQGVRPAERPLYLKYIKEMGGSAQILDEMAKAAPSAINEVDASNGQRKNLGLITQTGEDVSMLISVDHCQT